jgi:hypothetical protein
VKDTALKKITVSDVKVTALEKITIYGMYRSLLRRKSHD